MAKAVGLALMVVSVSAATSAQTPNPPAAIVEAASDCWEATGATSIDLAKLAAKGWKPAEIKDKDGKALKTPLRFFGKTDSGVMLMVLPGGDKPACSVTSRVGGTSDYKPLMDGLQTRLKQLEPGLKAGRAGTNGAAFLGGGRIALIEPTGTQTEPAARIVVGYSAAEKK